MAGVPEHFIQGIRQLPRRFRRDDVVAAFPDLKESTIIVYLSLLTKAGLLERRGPRSFERFSEATAEVDLPKHLRRLAGALEGKLLPSARSRLVAWGNEDLAPFLHDAVMDPFIVLEAPGEVHDTLKQALRDWAVHVVDNRPRLGTVIWHNTNAARDWPDVFLVPNTSLRGTRTTEAGIRIPIPERLLLDVLHMPAMEAALEILRVPDLDPGRVLSIAGERGRSAEAASFLTWAAIKFPDLPASKRLQERFPNLPFTEAV